MRRKGKNRNKSADRRRVLQGYRREGKRFIPPFLQHMSLTETSWIHDRVPELVWIALLNHAYGVKEGVGMAASIAKAAAKCEPAAKRAFAATSDYSELSDDQKQCIRSALNAEGILAKAGRGLAALIEHYTEFPLAFLAGSGRASEDSPGTTLRDLRESIHNISDKEGHAGIFAQATVVYIYFINKKLSVSPGLSLANFPAIEEYPKTDESKKVAAAVRATVSVLLSHDTSSDWRRYFWSQGRSLGPCEAA